MNVVEGRQLKKKIVGAVSVSPPHGEHFMLFHISCFPERWEVPEDNLYQSRFRFLSKTTGDLYGP